MANVEGPANLARACRVHQCRLVDVSTDTDHFCNAGPCSWHVFATEIVRLAGLDVPVTPIESAQLSRPAIRPSYSVLSAESFSTDTGMVHRPWRGALIACLELAQPVSHV